MRRNIDDPFQDGDLVILSDTSEFDGIVQDGERIILTIQGYTYDRRDQLPTVDPVFLVVSQIKKNYYMESDYLVLTNMGLLTVTPMCLHYNFDLICDRSSK